MLAGWILTVLTNVNEYKIAGWARNNRELKLYLHTKMLAGYILTGFLNDSGI